MGKNHRHQKQIKSEKAKVKLKSKGSKKLPKGLNITDASFKVKKIIIREQLKHQDTTEILSRRKLNVKDLLTRIQHYNSSVRQGSIRELKEILSEHSTDILSKHLNELLKGISALVLDKEKAIRRESLKALNLVLSPVTKEQLLPFANILFSYLTCAMTHINQNIMEDSLLFLDLLMQHCSSFLGSYSYKIFLYFLDMISKLHSQAKPGRQLTMHLNSNNTSIKWRLKVLNSLQQFLSMIVHNKQSTEKNSLAYVPKVYYIKDNVGCYPIYSSVRLKVCSINFKNAESYNNINNSDDIETLKNYIESLIPLMIDSWLEVRPQKQISGNIQLPISNEATHLLECITSITQSIIEYIELLENKNQILTVSEWFKKKFEGIFIKNLILELPYIQEKVSDRVKKFQQHITITSDDCLQLNLTLCYVYIWFTTVSCNTKSYNLNNTLCSQVLEFITNKLQNWYVDKVFAIPHMIKVLRILFLKAYIIWYKSKIPLENILKTFINTYLQEPKNKLQTHLFTLLKEIVMDHNLYSIHSEEVFKDFIMSLPALLLKNEIHDSTIQIINRVVLQHRQWLQKKLEQDHDSIIENAKTIKILGSEDEQNSRLMICNLFYFMDEQVYY